MGYNVNNCICLTNESGMTESVGEGRFATLENEVKHQGADIAEIKASTKSTDKAVRSIDVTLATLTAHIEQNKKLEGRIEKVELAVKGNNVKIATAAGGFAAVGFIVGLISRLKGFF